VRPGAIRIIAGRLFTELKTVDCGLLTQIRYSADCT